MDLQDIARTAERPADHEAIDAFSVRRQAVDRRADGARRDITIDRHGVTIERVFEGVRMRIGVPVAAYRGLVIAARYASGNATLTLRHADTDLDIVLARGEGVEVARKAKAWSLFLAKEIAIEDASVRMHDPIARRTSPPKRKRRSSFSQRRQVGVEARATMSFADEHEIIARS